MTKLNLAKQNKMRQERVRALMKAKLNQAAMKHLTKEELEPMQMPILTLMQKGMGMRQETLDKMSPEKRKMMGTETEQEMGSQYLTDLRMMEPKQVMTKLMTEEESLGETLAVWLTEEDNPEAAAVLAAEVLVATLQADDQTEWAIY